MPEPIADVKPTVPVEPIPLLTAINQRRRRANITATKVFLGSFIATTLASYLLCKLLVIDKTYVGGLTTLYSLFGFLFSYTLSLIIHRRIDPPAS